MVEFPKPVKVQKARVPIPRRRAGGKRKKVPEVLARHREVEKHSDALWSFIVRSRGQWCQRCGCRPAAHPHHLVSRRYRWTRWLTENGANICPGCHMLVGQDGDENRALAVKLIGENAWGWLNVAKAYGKRDPALMAVVLRQEISALRLTAQAREKGLL